MSSGNASGQLLTHLKSLLGQSRRPANDQTIWTDLLQSWQATGIPVTANDDEIGRDLELDIPVGIPLPTLLDYYSPPAGATRLDDPTNRAISFRPSSGAAGVAGDYGDAPALSGPEAEAAELTTRIQK
jgi:hypothetical protein